MSASGNEHLNYWERCGQEFDVAIGVLCGGPLGMTVSMRAALAAEQGKRWAVWLCAVLSVLVQPHHCSDTLSPTPSPWFVYVRAGIAFAVAIGAIGAMAWAALHIILNLVGAL